MTNDNATRRRKPLERPRVARYSIAVVEGPDTGSTVVVDDSQTPRILVGKSPVCDLKLSDSEVSRRHASLSWTSHGLVIIDLGSTNGTKVNGVTVKEAILGGGEALKLGSTTLTVRHEEDAPGAVDPLVSFGRVWGESRSMRRLFALLERLAAVSTPVLLEGEPGTEKELIAEELHAKGPLANGPFVILDVGVIPGDAERTLFGDGANPGLVAAARGGTLFIEEVAELPRQTQTRIARFLDDPDTRASMRVIAATRRDLDREITEGRFEEKLFNVLATGRLEVPPLRAREADATFLAERKWRALAQAENSSQPTLAPDFVARFEDYDWPGNVAELDAAVVARFTLGEEAVIHRREPAIDAAQDVIASVLSRKLPLPHARAVVVAEFERRYCEKMLAQHGGNVRKAAEASGVAHRYFQFLRARSR